MSCPALSIAIVGLGAANNRVMPCPRSSALAPPLYFPPPGVLVIRMPSCLCCMPRIALPLLLIACLRLLCYLFLRPPAACRPRAAPTPTLSCSACARGRFVRTIRTSPPAALACMPVAAVRALRAGMYVWYVHTSPSALRHVRREDGRA